jgi:hypothetical protein
MSLAIDHSKRKHSLVSPSGLYRIKECPASAIPLPFDVPEKTNKDAERGTRFHELMDNLLKLKKKSFTNYRRIFKQANRVEVDQFSEPNRQMSNYAIKALQYIRELKRKVGEENIVLEEAEDRVHVSDRMEGNIDWFLYYERGKKSGLMVLDFKYGVSPVAVKDNLQCIAYALGVINDYNLNPTIISTVIYQPRVGDKAAKVHHYTLPELREHETTVLEIEESGHKAIADGYGVEKVGGHCYFCNRKTICEAYRGQFNANAMTLFADVYAGPKIVNDLLPAKLMTPEQIEFIVEKTSELTSWVKEVNELALQMAERGQLPNYTVIVKEGNKKWIADEDKVAKDLISKGIPNPFKKSLKGIGDITKALGTGVDLDALITNHQAKLNLIKTDLVGTKDTSIFADIDQQTKKVNADGVKKEEKSKGRKGNSKKSTR